jgi:glutamyl-tRNA reductase
LHLFDVVLASTASTKALLTHKQVESAMKKRPSKPLFVIDASVPRNVEEAVSSVENVYLYNMDDVSAIANENLQSRLAEVERCRTALSKRALRLWEQMRTQPSLPS